MRITSETTLKLLKLMEEVGIELGFEMMQQYLKDEAERSAEGVEDSLYRTVDPYITQLVKWQFMARDLAKKLIELKREINQ